MHLRAAGSELSRLLQVLNATFGIEIAFHQDPAEDDRSAWDAQRAWLAATYPKFHAVATREIVGDGALIYTWKGSDPSLEPIILMAHQDVVPVADETLSQWKAPPCMKPSSLTPGMMASRTSAARSCPFASRSARTCRAPARGKKRCRPL